MLGHKPLCAGFSSASKEPRTLKQLTVLAAMALVCVLMLMEIG
jgi:hypothetical protein